MKKAATYFTTKEKERIENSVKLAERRTTAEIVPSLATSSGRYDRAEDIFGLLTGLAALAVAWLVFQKTIPAQWAPNGVLRIGLWESIGIVAGGFVLGATLASHAGWIRALFTPRRQMREEVRARAREVFVANRMYATNHGNGVLIYVSLFERMAVVLAEDHVIAKIGPDRLAVLRDRLIEGLREGHACRAYCETIRLAADALERHFPIPPAWVDKEPEPERAIEHVWRKVRDRMDNLLHGDRPATFASGEREARGNPDELPNRLVLVEGL